MAIINRDYLVIVDVRQSTINFNKDKIIFYITDKNTSNIFVNLATNISDNEYVDNYVSIEDARNYKVTMNIVKPDNTYKIIEGTLLDEEKALYEFNLEEECKDQIGTYICDIQSIRVDDEVERIITSNRFLYKVKAGVLNDLNEVIQSAESYPIVVELFDKLSYIERYEDERQANEVIRSEAEEQRQNRYDGLIDTILSRIQSMDDKLIEAEERLTTKEQEVDDCIEENTAKIDAKIQETDNKINELDTMFGENLDDVNEKIDETNVKLVEMDKSMVTNTSKINAKIDEADDVIGEMKTSILENTTKVDAKLGDVEKRISTKEKEVDSYISSAKTTLSTYQNTTTNRIDNYLRDKSVALDRYQSNKDIVINNKLNEALTKIDEKLDNIDTSNIDLTGYAKTEDIPTRVSQLTNDSNYTTKTYVDGAIANIEITNGGSGIIFENVEVGEKFTSVEEVIECTSISLDKTELSFTDTTPQTLVATTEPSNTTEKVVWSIDDESVVNVNDGVITPLKNGNAVITATCGSQSVSCDVTVSAIITRYSVVNNLTNCSNSNSATSIEENSSYSANISANEGYELGEVTCTMGGVAQTVTDGAINIASVTGDIIITAKATQSSIALPSEDSDKFYIQDGYAYIDPRTLNRHSLTSMNYDDTSDTEKAKVSFNLAPANRYEKTSEVLFNDFIPYNDTSATSYYYFNNTAIYAKIPRSEYVNANSDINQVLYKMFVRLPIKLSTTLTEYPLTTDIIDSITGSVATGQNENGYYNGFVNLPSTGIGIIDTNRTFCNKFGAISDILSTNKEDYAIKITTRFYYNVPAYKFPDGFTLDAFKTYLKSLELVFYY